MLGSLGWQELLIIFAILALIFGASRIGALGGALGKGIREFRQEAKGGDDKPAPAASSTVASSTVASSTEAAPAPKEPGAS